MLCKIRCPGISSPVSLVSNSASAFTVCATAFIFFFCFSFHRRCDFLFVLFQLGILRLQLFFDLFFEHLLSFRECHLSVCVRTFCFVILCLSLFTSCGPYLFWITSVAMTHLWSLPIWIMSFASASLLYSRAQKRHRIVDCAQ